MTAAVAAVADKGAVPGETLVSPQAAPDPGDDAAQAAEAIRRAQAELERAVAKAGLANDPLRYAFGGIAAALGAFGVGIEAMRRPADPAAVERLERAAVKGADRRAAELARAHTLRTVLVALALWIGSMGAVGVACYRWGHADAASDIQATGEGLALAFRDGPRAAADWLNLMRQNDIEKALAACAGGRSVPEAAGRRACSVPLWLEPPKVTLPRT